MKNREKKRASALKVLNSRPKISKGQQRKDKKLLQRLRRNMALRREILVEELEG